MERRQKGTGSLYRHKGRSRWMIAYWDEVSGERITEATGTKDRAEAQRLLNVRMGKIAEGEAIDKTTVGRKACTFEDAKAIFKSKQRNYAALAQALAIIEKQLAPAFGGLRLDQITTAKVDTFAAAKLDAGLADATVNSYLAVLRRMFKLAVKAEAYSGKVPAISTKEPDNARTGFFERGQFDAVCAALRKAGADWLIGPLTFGYFTGWRMQSEIATLEWRHVDLELGIVRITTSKNGQGRTFPVTPLPEVMAVLQAADRERKALAKRGVIVARVFHRGGEALVTNPATGRRFGHLQVWVREAWHAAVKAAGVPGLIPHDLRRTAVRNLVRKGISDKTAMLLTGHKTPHVFKRYDIVNEADLADAVARYAADARRSA